MHTTVGVAILLSLIVLCPPMATAQPLSPVDRTAGVVIDARSPAAVRAQADAPVEPASPAPLQLQTTDTTDLRKDPVVAMYLSATVPGLGQIYTGDKKRGVIFLASIIGAFGTAAASYEPARLHIDDYDTTAFGGNADGLISATEARNWQDLKFADTAFDRLSAGRKAGVVTGVAVGVGLYIWNVLDARTRAHHHNRTLSERRISVGVQAGGGRTGVAVGVVF